MGGIATPLLLHLLDMGTGAGGNPALEIAAAFIRGQCGGRFDAPRSARPVFTVAPIYFPGMFVVTLRQQDHDGTGRPPNP